MAQDNTPKKPTPRKPTPRSKASVTVGRKKSAPKLSVPASSTGSRLPKVGKRSAQTGRLQTPSTAVAAAPKKKQIFAAPSPAVRRKQRQSATQPDEGTRHTPTLKGVAIAVIVVATLAVIAVIALTILSHTAVFTINNVVATSSEHVSDSSIVRLAQVEEGATLLNLDADKIEENIKRNPWVAEVHLSRVFPSTLKITVTEHKVRALVIMNGSEVVWCLGDGGVWLEPISVKAESGESFKAAVLKKAQSMGALLIADSPAKLNPRAGSKATAESLQAAIKFEEGFTEELSKQILSYSAPSAASVSCTLKSGVTVSLGKATDITAKESVILALLKKHAGKITYINVRVASNPSYRMVDSDNVQEGTGALGEGASADDSVIAANSSGSKTQDDASSDEGSSDVSDESGQSPEGDNDNSQADSSSTDESSPEA
ncbi:FtsQ-type POTRA domain-containing protein [Atopobium sp. oral taxon 810]|uniref:cell division protein FtsQ/DivIB n=1 Tax=Atopobium sp. oral taxon 810 TaxID=712158 RepID=UPI000397AE9F|nr:FtsQ-type POTRA domain-containing protein [Atopobium sp. oral taxon 810]ERI03990.1 POTRA domain protein, FtsQ-type [Atopobium sp. oral taxon 810 str. F0209]